MKIDVAYADNRLILDIPDKFRVDIYSPRLFETAITFDMFRQEFLPAGEYILKHESPLIIVNDGYRHTPTEIILSWLDRLDSSFLDKAAFLISTGTHKAPTVEHYQKIFGRYYDRVRERIHYHDATDYSSMVELGKDRFAQPVWINRKVVNRGGVLILGSVEPHYFAGYTGGRKSLFPGLTDIATVARNHNMAVSLDAMPLKLAGNPVAEHLDELMQFLDMQNYFSIQIVQDASMKITGCFCGEMHEAFNKAVELAKQVYAYTVPDQYELIIAEMLPPLDRNLYQLQKGLENCQQAVKDGGTIVLISACVEGIGSTHFYQLAENWDKIRNKPRDGQLKFGSHKLSRVVDISHRIAVRLFSTLKGEDVRHVFYEPLDNPQIFLYSISSECENYNIAVVHDAGHTVLTT